tara:strand:- start:610 stop:768 length:159 start_codon:yes stop_codon:yes gene_type:complete
MMARYGKYKKPRGQYVRDIIDIEDDPKTWWDDEGNYVPPERLELEKEFAQKK